MLEADTPKNSVIKATLQLAEQKNWSAISHQEIADAAGCSLSELHEQFLSKKQILNAFFEEVDSAVLKTIQHGDAEEEEPAKDRLFDVLMTRFEVMQPYKTALKKLTSEFQKGRNLELISLKRLYKSNVWMLSAAGVRSAGGAGKLRNVGLSALYAQMLPTWLEDEDPGLAKTMSTLDRRLQEGEKWLKRADRFFEKGAKWCAAFQSKNSSNDRPSGNQKPITDNAEPDTAGSSPA